VTPGTAARLVIAPLPAGGGAITARYALPAGEPAAYTGRSRCT
jgi:hypothetical protein